MLKKPGLDAEMSNYRPVSNISFIAKVTEKVIAKQLTDHLTRHNLHDPLQSAYRKGASTETALLHIKTEAERILDDGNAVLMVLLDLSAAFDTIDHHLLLARLESEVGLKGAALAWIASYLSDRTQRVRVENSVSAPSNLAIGVPQGSVLGPLLFLVYLLPLRYIIEEFEMKRHGYADDTQLYCGVNLKDSTQLQQRLNKMESCLEKVREWMTRNKLKLNEAKTQVLLISRKDFPGNISIKIGEEDIVPVTRVKNLGAFFDSHLLMDAQVNMTTRSMYFHLRRIAKVRQHLTNSACAKAINATVISRLDYHNGLLLGQPANRVRKLQVAQNNAARLLSRAPKRQSITPVLKELHWLPVEKRIQYKVLCLIQQAVHSPSAPVYMKDLCELYTPRRDNLRSSNDPYTLTVSRVHNSFGQRSVIHSGAKLWNSLPKELRQPLNAQCFKKNLKTHLFKDAFL